MCVLEVMFLFLLHPAPRIHVRTSVGVRRSITFNTNKDNRFLESSGDLCCARESRGPKVVLNV